MCVLTRNVVVTSRMISLLVMFTSSVISIAFDVTTAGFFTT